MYRVKWSVDCTTFKWNENRFEALILLEKLHNKCMRSVSLAAKVCEFNGVDDVLDAWHGKISWNFLRVRRKEEKMEVRKVCLYNFIKSIQSCIIGAWSKS